MEKLKSWGVKCPEDYATNQKWIVYVDYHNKKYGNKLYGDLSGVFYGIIKTGKYDCTSIITLFDKILTIDEAHSMLFDKETEIYEGKIGEYCVNNDFNFKMQTPDNYITERPILTDYQKLRNAGFERQTIEDKVYFDIHGQHPFLMVNKLAKETKIVWNSVDNSIELMVINKDGDVMFRKALELEEVVG